MSGTKLRGLTAREFFDMDIDGGSMADAARGAGVSYPTIHAHVRGTADHSIRVGTAQKLEAWSRPVGAKHGVYISAVHTLGLTAPVRATGTDGAR